MRNRSRIRNRKPNVATGFTLVELLVVIVIIGILLVFILNAAMDSARRAEERATQTLIAKLEGGLNDRLDALLQTRPDYNLAHLYLAGIYADSTGLPLGWQSARLAGIPRAQVIAWCDYIKGEIPDVFFVQNTSGPYPLNFAANPYPGRSFITLGHYILPLGNSILNEPPTSYGDYSPATGSPQTNPNLGPAGSGIFGASYPAAAGVYKNLGYLPTGYDGVDNSQPGTSGYGLVDEWDEGIGVGLVTPPPGGPDPSVPAPDNPNIQIKLSDLIKQRLINHKHITARSEMLYALLVEGRGPLGSVFNRDEFTDKEVQDTDGDGLPEFVDAWGQPLQFFRWPLLYHSELQRGQAIEAGGGSSWTLVPPYQAAFQQREQDPLDLNQQLMAPAWWLSQYNPGFPLLPGTASQVGASPGVQAFEYFFHRLTEPLPNAGGPYYWDRGTASGYGARRAFYSKSLIVSSGPDQQLGIFLYADADLHALGPKGAPLALIANENNAMPFGLDVVDFTQSATIPSANTTIPYNPSADSAHPSSSDLLQAAQDDISNQNLQATGGTGGGSG